MSKGNTYRQIYFPAEMLAHLKMIPKFGLRGGKPGPGEEMQPSQSNQLDANNESDVNESDVNESDVNESEVNESEVNESVFSLHFDSDAEEMLGQIIDHQVLENKLEFDSESENYLNKENSKLDCASDNVSDSATASDVGDEEHSVGSDQRVTIRQK